MASKLRPVIHLLESVSLGSVATSSRGAYNRERKLNLMMAISADPVYDMEWHVHWPQEEGGDEFIQDVHVH